jgi:hypothetical protein
MLTNHQSPGIAAVMLGGIGARATERMRRTAPRLADVGHRRGHPGRVFLGRDGIRRTEYNVRGVDQLKAVDFLKHASRIFLAAGARRSGSPTCTARSCAARRRAHAHHAAQRAAERAVLRRLAPAGHRAAGHGSADSFAGPTGEAHRVPGLYVADGAALPGSVSVDPSLTIMGVARWIAAGMHAAAMAGAARVVANDIDAWALATCRSAAAANGVTVETLHADLCRRPDAGADYDVVLCSDLAYDRSETPRQERVLAAARDAGSRILAADAGRTYFEPRDMRLLLEVDVAVPQDLEGTPMRRARVYAAYAV